MLGECGFISFKSKSDLQFCWAFGERFKNQNQLVSTWKDCLLNKQTQRTGVIARVLINLCSVFVRCESRW